MAHILVADDDVQVVELMEKILTKAGHQVSTAGSGQETFQKLGIEPEDSTVKLPDLIILDIMMPKSDGYTVGTVLRNRERTRGIPILVVSALREMSRLFTTTVKVDGFITKPFAPNDLTDGITRILSARRLALRK